jgi:hypothetical protein
VYKIGDAGSMLHMHAKALVARDRAWVARFADFNRANYHIHDASNPLSLVSCRYPM